MPYIIGYILLPLHSLCFLFPGWLRRLLLFLHPFPFFLSMCCRMLEYSLNLQNVSFTAVRTVRVLRPLRAINRVPSEFKTHWSLTPQPSDQTPDPRNTLPSEIKALWPPLKTNTLQVLSEYRATKDPHTALLLAFDAVSASLLWKHRLRSWGVWGSDSDRHFWYVRLKAQLTAGWRLTSERILSKKWNKGSIERKIKKKCPCWSGKSFTHLPAHLNEAAAWVFQHCWTKS